MADTPTDLAVPRSNYDLRDPMALARVTRVIIESMAEVRQRTDRASQACCNQLVVLIIHGRIWSWVQLVVTEFRFSLE